MKEGSGVAGGVVGGVVASFGPAGGGDVAAHLRG